MRRIYFQFYKATYKPSQIDRKTKELIAIAASLGYQCQGCLEGHIKKAIEFGATREEISEAICIAMGVAAASVVDQTDILSEKLPAGPLQTPALASSPYLDSSCQGSCSFFRIQLIWALATKLGCWVEARSFAAGPESLSDHLLLLGVSGMKASTFCDSVWTAVVSPAS